MAIHKLSCRTEGCTHEEEMIYRMAEDPAKLAAAKTCPKCSKPGTLAIDFSACRVGDPIINFREGFYNIGTSPYSRRGKYYGSLREMRNDAARNGIDLSRS